MGIRETINARPAVACGVIAGIVVVSIAATLWSNRRPSASTPEDAAYTIDNGKTWFSDEHDRVIPYSKEGATVIGAVLFSSDGGKSKFVGYLQRYGTVVEAKNRTWPSRLSQLPG